VVRNNGEWRESVSEQTQAPTSNKKKTWVCMQTNNASPLFLSSIARSSFAACVVLCLVCWSLLLSSSTASTVSVQSTLRLHVINHSHHTFMASRSSPFADTVLASSFHHQVGGHHPCMRINATTIAKQLQPHELAFYQSLASHKSSLEPFVPKFLG
jgi:hypothetical protein